MKNTQRYRTQGSDEGEHQPGSEDGVLKNLLGITSEAEIEQLETLRFVELSREIILSLPQDIRTNESYFFAGN